VLGDQLDERLEEPGALRGDDLGAAQAVGAAGQALRLRTALEAEAFVDRGDGVAERCDVQTVAYG